MLTEPSSDVYSGAFVDGLRHGEGKLMFAEPREDGVSMLEGQWCYGDFLDPDGPRRERESRIAHEAALLAQPRLLAQLSEQLKADAPKRIDMYFFRGGWGR